MENLVNLLIKVYLIYKGTKMMIYKDDSYIFYKLMKGKKTIKSFSSPI